MHMRDALVDTEGQVVAHGQIAFPCDDAGLFPLPDHRFIRVSVVERGLRLAAATAERDPRTNFLLTQEFAPVICLGDSQTRLIVQALRVFPGEKPTEVQY